MILVSYLQTKIENSILVVSITYINIQWINSVKKYIFINIHTHANKERWEKLYGPINIPSFPKLYDLLWFCHFLFSNTLEPINSSKLPRHRGMLII